MPVDRGAIDAQLREIGEGERWWELREFRALPHVLHSDERILALVEARFYPSRRSRVIGAGRWLVVATTQRLICLKQERGARRQVDITPAQVTRMQQRSRLRDFQITLETPLRTYRMRIAKSDAFRFSRALARLLPESPVHEGGDRQSRAPALPAAGQRYGTAADASGYGAGDGSGWGEIERLGATVEQLQAEVKRLQERLAVIEDELRQQPDETVLAPSSAHG